MKEEEKEEGPGIQASRSLYMTWLYDHLAPWPAPYLQELLQGLEVRGKLVHFVLVVGVLLDEGPHGLYLGSQFQPLFL